MVIIKNIHIISDNSKKYKKLLNILKKNKKVNIKRYNIISDKTSDKINLVTSDKSMCTPELKDYYNTHLGILYSIVKNNLDHVLVLDGDVSINSNFYDLFYEYQKEVPNNWDILYLGCTGSCDSSSIKNNIYNIFNRANKDTYIKNKKMVYVFQPGTALGLYGYMITNTAAKKILNVISHNKSINCNLDYFIANDENLKDLNIYAFTPALVNLNANNNITLHPTLNPDNFSLYNSKYLYYNSYLDLGISYYSLIIWTFGMIVSYYNNDRYTILLIESVTFIQLLDMANSKTDKDKIKILLFELLLFYLIIFLFRKIRNKN